MRTSMFSAAGLVATALLVSATISSARAEDVAKPDYCTTEAGFAPCPKLVWQPQPENVAGAAEMAPDALARRAGFDQCTSDTGFAPCARIDQFIALREWARPDKYAAVSVRVE